MGLGGVYENRDGGVYWLRACLTRIDSQADLIYANETLLTLSRKFVFAALTTLLVLGATEVTVRLASDTVAKATIPADEILAHTQSTSMERNPLLGWVHQPLPDPSNGINTMGWRYPEELTKQPPGWRAFAMGDSQTYGAGVDSEQSYPAIAQAALRAVAPQAQLINAACSGYGSLQALRQIREQLHPFNPDLYIVDARPFDQPRDELVPPVDGTIQRLLFHSRLYYLMRVAIEEQRQQTERMGGPQRKNTDNGNHKAIVAQAGHQGVPVLFVDYPFWNRAQGDIRCVAPASRMPWNAPVAGVCEALQADGRHPRELFFDANHLNIEGNKVAGQALAQAILDLGLGPGGTGWQAPESEPEPATQQGQYRDQKYHSQGAPKTSPPRPGPDRPQNPVPVPLK